MSIISKNFQSIYVTNLSSLSTSATYLSSTNITATNLVVTAATIPNIILTGNLNANGTSNTFANIFTTGGNVGINTTSPVFTLDISGSTRITGGLTTGTLTAVLGASISSLLSSSITTSSLNTTSISTTNIISTNNTINNLNTVNISSSSLFSTNITSTNVIGINITTSALISNLITVSSILATTNISTSNVFSTNITSTNLVSTFTSLGNLTSLTGTFANKVGGSQTVGNILVTTSANLSGSSNTIGSIFTTGGNVGINTTSPVFTLDISGSTRITGGLTTGTLTAVLGANISSLLSSSITTSSLNTTSISTTNIISTNNTINNLNTVNISSISLFSTNITSTNVIGTNITTSALISNLITVGSILATTNISTSNVFSTNITSTNLFSTNTSLGNLTSLTGTFANKVGGSQTVGTILVTTSANLGGSSNTIGSIFTTGGNVGINTTSPSFPLDVVGLIRSLNLTPIVGPNDLIHLGQSESNNNMAIIDYNYITVGSSLNSMGLGFYGANNKLVVQAGGNIGINTLTPTNSLSINGNININCTTASLFNSSNTQKLVVSGDASGTFASDSAQLIICGTTDQTKRLGLMIDTTNNVGIIQAGRSNFGTYPVCLNAAGGSVGINTTSPVYTLDVSGNGRFNGNGLAINNVSSPYTNSESANNAFQIYSSSSTATVSLYMGTDATNNISWIQCSKSGTMLPICINPRGLPNAYLGIGTPAPLYPLHVVGSATNIVTGGYYFYANNNSGNTLIPWSTSNQAIGIFATSAILTQSNFLASSDQRIKNICDEKINLDLIDLINPVIYTYKDKIKNPKKNIGFIAQNVFEHCPEAVTLHKGIIPDIMKLVDIIEIKDTIITIKNEWQLKEKDVIKIIIDDKDTAGELIDIVYADKDTIKFKHKKLKEKVFIYGRQVEDFHELNYDYVFALGFAGIQRSKRDITVLIKDNILLKQNNISLRQDIDNLTKFIKSKFQDKF